MNFEDIFGHDVAKRALEIAITGDHSVLLISPKGQGKTMLITAATQAASIAGAKMDYAKHAEIRPDALAEQIAGVHNWQPDEFDIVITMSPLTAVDWFLPPPCDTSVMIAERVRQGRKALGKLPPVRDIMDGGARELLKGAFEKLNFSPDQAARVERVARTIAALQPTGIVGRVHVAEALSYVYRA